MRKIYGHKSSLISFYLSMANIWLARVFRIKTYECRLEPKQHVLRVDGRMRPFNVYGRNGRMSCATFVLIGHIVSSFVLICSCCNNLASAFNRASPGMNSSSIADYCSYYIFSCHICVSYKMDSRSVCFLYIN